MKTKIIIVRHGESLGNKEKYLLGHTDLDMSQLGYRQAASTASYLAEEKIDVIYSSDLIRAYNTAKPHAELRGLQIIKDEKLREVQLGDWEGKHISYILENYKDEYETYKAKTFGTYTFPKGGDSVEEAGVRFFDEIMSIASENTGKTVLVVTHAAVLRSFYAKISGIEPRDVAAELPFATNASVSLVEYDGERLVPRLYSFDEHLRDVGITKVNA